MPKPMLIIIAGPPGTGKTTLGNWLAEELRLPFVNKDGIKESLFDSLGWKDREWSKRLAVATYDLIYYFVRAQLAVGASQIVESNFDARRATGEFLKLKEKYDFAPFQIQCRTEGEVLLKRYNARAVSGLRHPGHVEEAEAREELKPVLLKGYSEPLEIGGALYQLDTTDFQQIDYAALLTAIRDFSKQL